MIGVGALATKDRSAVHIVRKIAVAVRQLGGEVFDVVEGDHSIAIGVTRNRWGCSPGTINRSRRHYRDARQCN